MSQSETGRDPLELAMGRAIKAARLAAGLSMTALAERCGVSQPYVSQLENGKGSPSISTLYRIANALGVSPQDLLPGEHDDFRVVRSGSQPQRPIEDRVDAARARVLVGSPDALLQVQEVDVGDGQDLGGFFEHEGEELVYVVEGRIVVDVGTHPATELTRGDAVWYKSTLPHRWARLGPEPVRLLVVSATVPGRGAHT